VKSRLWLRFLLLSLGAVACCTHVLAVSSTSWHTGSGGASLFALGAIGLPVLMLLNERLAAWRWGGQFLVGPCLLAGITIPNVLLSIQLSLMAVGEAINTGGVGWGIMGYVILPLFWIIALPIAVLIGAIVDSFRLRP